MNKIVTKGKVLQYLYETGEYNILPVFIVNSDEFINDSDNVIRSIMNKFTDDVIIVRSSSSFEDQDNHSNAGKFISIPNVSRTDKKMIKKAIKSVYASYGTDTNQEILIQPMAKNIVKSGVVFTGDVNTLAKYFTINWENGNDTDAVTSGKRANLRTRIVWPEHEYPNKNDEMYELILTCKRLRKTFNNDYLDIEFGIDDNGKVLIFQVRPLILKGNVEIDQSIFSNMLEKCYKKISKLVKPHPYLLGETTVFGVMPDWNPAEILGVRPKRLAISLYKELVTDNVWAHQRLNYGYRDLTAHPLMTCFCGIPYIDTRITFNSFIPGALNEKIARKLADFYINQLINYPIWHDKIEFEIVYSCYYLGIEQKLRKLLNYGFNENEINRISFSLLTVTNNIINSKDGFYKKDLEKVKTLEERYENIVNAELSLTDKIYWMIEDCKNYGTLPFAGIARAGFIAVQFLRSFVEKKIITKSEYNKFMNSLNTINKQLNNDLLNVGKGKYTKEMFLEKYGHVRPGTYDIMSKRYDEAFDEYFSLKNVKKIKKNVEYHFTKEQMAKIQDEIDESGLVVTADELIKFIKEAIEGREYSKFIFTKSISKILVYIEQLCKRVGISREDAANLDVGLIKGLYVNLNYENLGDILKRNISENKEEYKYAQAIKLPSIILSPDNVWDYELLDEEPNFITLNRIEAEVVTEEDLEKTDLKGKIIFIQAADPGYDFLFSRKIGGLVTQFGGANSHMAIRCAELGIPAIIGAGEYKFDKWKKYKYACLDCQNRKFSGTSDKE